MADLGYAIDAYLGHLAREGRRPATLSSYRRLLNKFADLAYPRSTDELRLSDYERFLDHWIAKSPSTLASAVSLVRGFSAFLEERGLADDDYARVLKRPRRQRPEDLDVVTISTEDAQRLLSACEDWQEILCIGSALYLGWRRAALNRLRRADLDLVRGTMRVLEKGGKTVTKPVPDQYLDVLRQAEAAGLWDSPEAYLIPNRRPASLRRVGERSDKIIWTTVKRVARRAGVRTHVHALRAAFAVTFMEQENDHRALQDLMGHSRAETTDVYLRRWDKSQSLEKVRNLSFLPEPPVVFESQAEEPPRNPCKEGVEAHTGFEPVFAPIDLVKRSTENTERIGGKKL